MSSLFFDKPLPILLILFALSIVPFVFMISTSFVKISVVLSILRSALGTGQAPSGTVISALAAVLTLYVMGPTLTLMADQAIVLGAPLFDDKTPPKQSTQSLIDTGMALKKTLGDFLSRNAGTREKQLFVRLSQRHKNQAEAALVNASDFLIALPAFLITELSRAFIIGFVLFIPFLVVDMVVANVLLALGMHMLSPTTISLPFKLLLFVMVDGWFLVSQALVLGYK